MYIFSRVGTLKPDHIVDGTTFAVDIAAKVKTITGTSVNVYRALYGQPFGTILWSVRAESQAEIADLTAKLAADPGYMDASQKGATLFTGNHTAGLANVVSTTMAAPKPIVIVTQAVIANGKFAKAMELGVAAQTLVAKITGQPTTFASDTFGAYGGVRWLVGCDTMEQVDHVQQVMTTDAKLIALVESGSDLFVEGSGQNGMIQKIN